MKMQRWLGCGCGILLACAVGNAQGSAQVFSHTELKQQIDKLTAIAREKGSSGSTLGDYGSHALKLSLRGKSGGAEVHAHFDDVMVVLDGSATLITGGTVVNVKTDAEGEEKGASIRGGITHQVVKGDILHIPAGTPHQLILGKDEMFTAFVVKIRE